MQLSVAGDHELCSMEMKFLEYQTFFETLLSSKFQNLANDVLFPFNWGTSAGSGFGAAMEHV